MMTGETAAVGIPADQQHRMAAVLTPSERRIFERLARAGGRPVTVRTLALEALGFSPYSLNDSTDQLVRQHVCAIRKALGARAVVTVLGGSPQRGGTRYAVGMEVTA